MFGIPNDEWGEEIKALVEPSASCNDPAGLPSRLAQHCERRLASSERPRSIEPIAQLPRDPNGKLDERRLRDPWWAGRDRNI